MRAQTLFVVVSAIAGALAAPIQARDPKMVTVYENVLHLVTATSTVWVKPSPTYKPEGGLPTTTSPPFQYAPSPATSSSSSSMYTPPPPPPAATHIAPRPTRKPKVHTPRVYVAPPPAGTSTTSSYVAPPPASSPPAPSVSVSSSGGDGGSYNGGSGGASGTATYYSTGMGSCGKESHDGDNIVAISYILMDAKSTGNPNTNPYCGRQIELSRGGKSVVCTVVDTCPGCDATHFDLSPNAFNTLGQAYEGVIPISYKWVN